jgi:hypothetical protein
MSTISRILVLTADIYIHDSSAVFVVCSDSFTIITVPQTNPAALACCKKQIAIFIVFHACQWPVMTFQQNWAHCSHVEQC